MSVKQSLIIAWQGINGVPEVNTRGDFEQGGDDYDDYTIPANTSIHLNIGFIRDNLKMVFIKVKFQGTDAQLAALEDPFILFETNHGSIWGTAAPQDAYDLRPNHAWSYSNLSGHPNPFDGNVTSLYFTNNFDLPCSVTIRIADDPIL